MTEIKLTLKEMCDKFDVTPRTLRHYEYIELLAPEKQGRTRFYGAREQARLKLILRARRFGFSLEDARQWLEMYKQDDSNREQMERWIDLSEYQLEELEFRKIQLQETIDELKSLQKQTRKQLET